jgi:hypothetical protein
MTSAVAGYGGGGASGTQAKRHRPRLREATVTALNGGAPGRVQVGAAAEAAVHALRAIIAGCGSMLPPRVAVEVAELAVEWASAIQCEGTFAPVDVADVWATDAGGFGSSGTWGYCIFF